MLREKNVVTTYVSYNLFIQELLVILCNKQLEYCFTSRQMIEKVTFKISVGLLFYKLLNNLNLLCAVNSIVF